MTIKCKRISMKTVDELNNWLEDNDFVPVRNVEGVNEYCDYVYVRKDGSVATKTLFRGKKLSITYWLPEDLQTGDHWGYVVFGTKCIDINGDKQKMQVRLHKLIMQTFKPTTDNSLEIYHVDGNKLNNALSNLEYVTHAENINRYWTKERRNRSMNISCCGQYPNVYMTFSRETSSTVVRIHKCNVCGKTIPSMGTRKDD